MNICIPLPIQIVIDDVGWWNGKDDSSTQEPYRTGFVRNHVPADYQAIVELGRKLNVRPQAATILAEWDRENIVATVPSCSKQGRDWDNSQWVGPWLDEAAEIMRNNSQHFELALHGIGHEFWKNGKFSRGEWYDEQGRMRPHNDVLGRIDLFSKLLKQNELGPFPQSFVPPGFVHTFCPDDETLITLLKRAGIRYISTPFSCMLGSEKTQKRFFGVDRHIITIDRGADLFGWREYDCFPEGKITGPICGMHWPNILHADVERNIEVVDRWVEFLKPYNERIDRIIAPDMATAATQLVYHECTQMKKSNDGIELSFNEIDKLSISYMNDSFFLKVEGPSNIKFSGKHVQIMSYSWNESSAYHTLRLRRCGDIAQLTWKIDNKSI